MAMIVNPVDGTLQDGDAPPPTPADVLAMPNVAPPVNAVESGGGTTITIPEGGSILPAPAAHEVERSTTRTLESGAEKANQATIGAAQAQEAQASQQVGQVEQDIAHEEIKHADRATEIAKQAKRDAEQAEADYQKRVVDRNAEEKDLVDKSAKAGIAAGEAKSTYWSGNPVGQVLAAIVQAVAAGEQARVGRDGMSPAERIIIGKINDYERMMISKWELTKEARDMKRADRPAWEAAQAKIKVEAANRSARDKAIMDAAHDRVIKGFGPAKAAAMRAEVDAARAKADALIEQKRVEGLRVLEKFGETDRTGSTKDAKPASVETRALVTGAAEYERLAAKNLAILEANGGKPPLEGPAAQEFETNDTAMSKILQEPLGKSDSDAEAADKLQASPGLFGKLAAQVGVGNTAVNYRKALEVNAKRLKTKAADVARAEGKPVDGGAAKPAETGRRGTVNGKPAMIYPDGWEPIP